MSDHHDEVRDLLSRLREHGEAGLRRFVDDLERLPLEVTVRCCVASAWRLLEVFGRCARGHDRDVEAIAATEDWVACPCAECAERAWSRADESAEAQVVASVTDEQVTVYDLATWTGYAASDFSCGTSALRSCARPPFAAHCLDAIVSELTSWLEGGDPIPPRRAARRLAHSKRLCAKLEQLARDEERGVHPEFYRLTVEDYGGSGCVLVERVQPPYQYVRILFSTVEALLATEAEGTPFEQCVRRMTITGDTAPLLLTALRRVFPAEDADDGA